jgi:enoyl-CoA hydratase
MYTTLLTSLSNGIYQITINRPDKLNALNKTVMSELKEAVDEIYLNAEIKSAIITGSGQKAFVAGADISGFIDMSKKEGLAMAKKGHDLFFRIEDSPKPIVAAVNGFALGGGCELAMACHFRIASENAKFGQPEVNLGLVPGYGGTQRLTKLIGKGRATELLISGNMIDAQTAWQFGLVNHVVPAEELLQKTTALLETINAKAPLAVGHCIRLANIAENGLETENSADAGFVKEIEAFGECFASEDLKEGAAAFLEKRKAIFRGH